MGCAAGAGKKEVLDPASGDLVQLGDAPGPSVGKTVLIDLSGWAHIGAKRNSRQVRLRCCFEPRTSPRARVIRAGT
eukprot:7187921-Prymnesium_polylepis.1